ncbi:septation protein A [Massilia sp. Dwa41.01b]|uniref:septation protein A n=1 Tax=unclassified Massilia TaxID=2609279 RepID=UPI00160464C1|nr:MULTISPECIES: septation protein A [unclassified Massilia]QNA89029.1 septation protein A [Massilia sp. Dwa41.01b]QNA99917.1 septation protein A [Massilia sp. Se16.2.3]
MKFLFDLFPLILFFIAYKWGNGNEAAAAALVQQYLGGLVSGGTVAADQAAIMLATAVGILATVLQIGYLVARRRKVDGMLWVSFVVIVVFGGATIYFHDKTFMLWKPTILYWASAVILFVSQVFFGKNLMRKAMEEALPLPDALWPRVGFIWIGFFILLGALNLLMAFVVLKDDTNAWVNFKMYGMTAIFFIFTVALSLLLVKHVPQEEA